MSLFNAMLRRVPTLPSLLESSQWCSSCLSQRNSSSKFTLPKEDHAVTITRRGDKLVCWHPEKDFPYELSQPMPRDQKTLEMGDSPSMLRYHPVLDEKKSKSGPADRDLMKVFYTAKHVWRPCVREKRRALNPIPKERNAL